MTEQRRDREDKKKFLLVYFESQKKKRMSKGKGIFVELMANERIII